MGYYKRYNLSVGIPYLVQFICAKCGAENRTIHVVKAETSYNDKGVIRKKTLQKLDSNAREELSEKTRNLISRIEEEKSRNEYQTIHLNCKCSKCNKRPVWSFPSWLKVFEILKDISIVLVFLSILYIFSDSSGWVLFPIAASPAVLYFLIYYLYLGWQKKRTRELNPKYLPMIVKLDKQ